MNAQQHSILDKGEAMFIDKKRIITGIVIALIVFIATSYVTSLVSAAGWETKIENHIADPDVHMRLNAKLETFVTRAEYNEMMEELKAIKVELQDINHYLRNSK